MKWGWDFAETVKFYCVCSVGGGCEGGGREGVVGVVSVGGCEDGGEGSLSGSEGGGTEGARE